MMSKIDSYYARMKKKIKNLFSSLMNRAILAVDDEAKQLKIYL